MEMTERKEKILTAVVESYITNGEPIGSKSLQQEGGLAVSSATIRNELAELTELGLLVQPHTSAGRIPTNSGYRYYVDRLMPKIELSPSAKSKIEAQLLKSADAPEHILTAAAQLLSDITGIAAIATTPDGKDARVHKLRFVRTGRRTAMAVLITSTGMVKTSLFRCEFVITPEMLTVFEQVLNKALAGVPLVEVTTPFIQTTAASLGELSLFLPSVLKAIMELCSSSSGVSVSVAGKVNLLYLPEFDLENGRDILRFLNQGEQISDIFPESGGDVSVLIGTETGRRELARAAVISSRYQINGKRAGRIALLGPIRMDYSSKIAILKFTTELCSQLISELITE